jgi:NAD(P)H-hydrate epimerase
MIGAPALAAAAALRAGCGLAKLACPAPVLPTAIGLCPAATGLPVPADELGQVSPHDACAAVDRCVHQSGVLAIGPGMGTSPGSVSATLRAAQQDEVYVLFDADAINCIGAIPEFTRDFRAAAVFTPHPGEFQRLVTALGLKGDLGLAQSRTDAAAQLAQRLGAVIVLKGSGTVVSDGQRTWVNTIDHPCLATGGSGDVLSGIIAGLIAQFVPSPQQSLFRAKVRAMPMDPQRPLDLFEAACIGVQVHGAAGQAWARANAADGGLVATDLLPLVPPIIQSLRTP